MEEPDDTSQPPPPSMLRHLRGVLGDNFLVNRPSFERCKRRLAHREPSLVDDFTRVEYAALMDDIRRLQALLKEADVDQTKFEVERYTVNSWSKGNFQVKAHLRRKDEGAGPPVVEPPPIARYVPYFAVPLGCKGMGTLCIPDIHFGFLADTVLDDEGSVQVEWETIHDPQAVSLTLAVAEAFRPPTIVILGDMLDLPGLGRWDTSPTQRQQTLTAIQAARQFLGHLRGACPDSRIILLEGNHEKRLADYLCRNAPEMLWAADVPGLLGLAASDLRVEYVAPYRTKAPVGQAQAISAMHGYLIGKTGGESSAKNLREHSESTIYGHTHRLELAYRTSFGPDNRPRHIFSMGCGTLARIDGKVPGSVHPDWQQGFGFLTAHTETPHIVPIRDRACEVLGRHFSLPAQDSP